MKCPVRHLLLLVLPSTILDFHFFLLVNFIFFISETKFLLTQVSLTEEYDISVVCQGQQRRELLRPLGQPCLFPSEARSLLRCRWGLAVEECQRDAAKVQSRE